MGGTWVNSRTGFQPVGEASRTGFQPVPSASALPPPATHHPPPATPHRPPASSLSEGFPLLRLILGLILLLAAGLKAHQLATDPLVTLAPLPSSLAPILHSRPFLIGVVECELLFGLVLLSGILPRLTWLLSLVCFGGFALISLYKGISGDATCGCFGRVPVNPWYTFALDAAAVLALLRWRPRGLSLSHVPTFSRFATIAAVWLFVGTPVALATWSEPVSSLTDLGEVLAGGRIVILKPETWVGKRLPLLDYMDISDEVRQGRWAVLLYYPNCPKCQEAIVRLRGIAAERTFQRGWRVALAEIPPRDDNGESTAALEDPICVWGRLSHTREWLVESPVLVTISNGTVIDVQTGDDVLTSIAG